LSNTLELVNVCKSYNVDILRNVSLKFQSGQVHVLIGENAAGKSTIVKMLSGSVSPDSGSILFNGSVIRNHNVKSAGKLKIGTMFQTNTLFEEISVLENIFIKNYPGYRYAHPVLNHKKMLEVYHALMNSIGFELNSETKVKDLTPSQKRIVELAKALQSDPDIILFDEPTASFSNVELRKFYILLQKMKQSGKMIIYVTHNIKEAIEISDIITVLHNGQVSQTFFSSSADEATLLKSVAGSEYRYRYPRTFNTKGRPVLKVSDLSNEYIRNVSFSAYEGEILGITGLSDSGKSHIGMVLFGLESYDAGSIKYFGLSMPHRMTPKDVTSMKLGYISGDTSNTFIPEFTPEMNITLSNIRKISPNYYIHKKVEYEATNKFYKQFGIPGMFSTQKTVFLSCGLKQKINISRALFSNANILVMDEPTQSIDPASKSDVYNLMNDYVKYGKTIVLISSDFEEIAGMCDRVIVMRKGLVVGELHKRDLNKNDIIYYSVKQI
jgi:ribose transport system ATP-binding protein